MFLQAFIILGGGVSEVWYALYVSTLILGMGHESAENCLFSFNKSSRIETSMQFPVST